MRIFAIISFKGLVKNIQNSYNSSKRQPSLKVARDLNKHFSKEEHMASKCMKRCSSSLVTRAVQINITMRYHFYTH